MDGLIETTTLLESNKFHPLLSATKIAFGFVYIQPFEDGNGRIHRYLIHNLLSIMKFTPQGIIFPVSSAILDRIDYYRKVLESYSQPKFDFIKWKRAPDNNVEVPNETIDYYRHFDATVQVEFLFECVESTIHNIIPQEVSYLQKYDSMKSWLDDSFEMPDKMVALLIRFLEQNNGVIPKRVREKEFESFSQSEIEELESKYRALFMD